MPKQRKDEVQEISEDRLYGTTLHGEPTREMIAKHYRPQSRFRKDSIKKVLYIISGICFIFWVAVGFFVQPIPQNIWLTGIHIQQMGLGSGYYLGMVDMILGLGIITFLLSYLIIDRI